MLAFASTVKLLEVRLEHAEREASFYANLAEAAESGEQIARDQLDRERRAHMERMAQLYAERDQAIRAERARHEARERTFVNQIQAMAERLASLKIQQGEAGVVVDDPNVPFTPEEDSLPYSDGLLEFLGKIEFEEAREMTEQFIEQKRAAGMYDEQILQLLTDGAY